MLALLVWLVAAQDIQVSAEVDRDRLGVGDALTYTARVVVAPGAPVTILLPGAIDGFSIIGRDDRREPVGADGAADVYTVELRLRAQRVGLFRIGAIRFRQGDRLAVSPELEVAVEAGARVTGPVIGARVLRMLQRAPPPPVGDVAVTLLVSADTVMVGEQVDVVTAAWFPRELLGRLRRPPSLRPPAVDGVYSAVQPSAAGVAMSRAVNGVWYDLYVAHQIVFPVQEGTVDISGAGLSFSVPAGRQYFSEERPYNLSSSSRRFFVRSVPGNRQGPVARDLTLQYELGADPARAGEPLQVDLVLSGSGNLALWPGPVVVWPEGSRGYAGDVVDRPRLSAGLVGGTKRFRYVVIADSSGTLALPDVTYGYFDPGTGRWREAVARAVVLPVQPRAPLSQPRRAPALLTAEPYSVRAFHPPVLVLLGLLLVLPPLLAVVAGARRRTRQPAAVAPGGAAADELHRRVRRLVPDPDARQPGRLVARLREAGLGSTLSAEVAQLYDALTTERFDPARRHEPAPLEAEARRVLRAWPRRVRRGLSGVAGLLALAGATAAPAAGQGAADSLYRAGAHAASAEEWLRAAAGAPASARYWFNAGAAAWAAGQDARAAGAWIEARRLAPRHRGVSRAWDVLASRSADLQRAGRVSPLTPVELALLAALVWAAGWLMLVRRHRRIAAACWGVAALVGLAAFLVLRWYQRPVGILSRAAALREVPHGLAEEVGRADDLAVVSVRDRRTGWRLVQSTTGLRGWVPEAVIVEVRGLHYGP